MRRSQERSQPDSTACAALSRRQFSVMAVGGLGAILAGCATQQGPFQAKATTPPAIKNCFDSLGHQGFKPFVLGGTCYCNPLPAKIAVWQKEGHFEGKSADEIMTYYKARDVKTVFDHQNCNNLCEWGPHVVKGGKCMVPPTPLTDNYEEVATGNWRRA